MSVVQFPRAYALPPKAPDRTPAPRQYKPAPWQLPPDVRARFIKAHAAFLKAERDYHNACCEITANAAEQHGFTESTDRHFELVHQDPGDTLLTLDEVDLSVDCGWGNTVCHLDPDTGELLEEIPTDPDTGERLEGQA